MTLEIQILAWERRTILTRLTGYYNFFYYYYFACVCVSIKLECNLYMIHLSQIFHIYAYKNSNSINNNYITSVFH
jgi:hypothetical protein